MHRSAVWMNPITPRIALPLTLACLALLVGLAFPIWVEAATNRPAQGAPTITGTAKVGQELTADISGIRDDDGVLSSTITYQWLRVDDDAETGISRATSMTYTLVTADVGKTIRVRVGFTDNAGFPESLKSVPTASVMTVPPGPPQNLVAVSRNKMIELSWKPPALNGGSPITHYLVSYVPVGERVNPPVLPVHVHERVQVVLYPVRGLTDGKRYEFRVLAVNSNGDRGSNAIVLATPGVNNPAQGAPTITGTARVGQELIASTSDITDADGLPNTFTYQWLRVDGGMETPISGAASKTYTPVTADVGKTLRVKVGFTDNANSSESLTSVPTASVQPPLSIEPVKARVTEGEDAVFRITRSGASDLPSEDIRVALDYHDKIFSAGSRPNKTRTLTFAQGRTEVGLTIPTNDDQQNRGDGMIRATIIGDPGSPRETWIHVLENDVPAVTLSTDKQSIIEGETFKWILKRSCCSAELLQLPTSVAGIKHFPASLGGGIILIARVDQEPGTNIAGYIPAGQLVREFTDGGLGGRNPLPDLVGPLGGFIERRIRRPVPTDPVVGIPAKGHSIFQRKDYSATEEWVRVQIYNRSPGIKIESRHKTVNEGDTIHFTISRYGGAPEVIKNYSSSVRFQVEQKGDYLNPDGLIGAPGQSQCPPVEADGNVGGKRITLPIGVTSCEMRVFTMNDTVDEDNGEVTVIILPGDGTGRTEDTYELDEREDKISVVVQDDDIRGVTVTPVGLSVDEGASATYKVKLTSQPSDDVVITLVSSNTDVTLPESTLTFTSGDWNTEQTVTVHAVENDDDTAYDSVNAVITHTVSGGDYASARAAVVTVSVTDNDATAVTLSGPAGDVTEGGTKVLTVSLSRGLVSGELLMVPLTFAGDATRGTDYTLVCASATVVPCGNLDSGSATVTLIGVEGGTATQVTITLTALADKTVESTPETVVIGLGTLMDRRLDGGATKADELEDFRIADPVRPAWTLRWRSSTTAWTRIMTRP